MSTTLSKIWLGLVATLVATAVPSFAFEKAPAPYSWRNEDARVGYIDTISKEPEDIGVPMYIVDNPEAGELSLHQKLFDPTLTTEFSHKYQEQFGKTEAEVFYTTNSISDEYLYQGHQYTQQQYFDQQKAFSTYMIRRMAEYHFDKGAQSSPITKSVYSIKEKVRNMDVAISQDVKVNARYTISGNDFQVDVLNPWLISKVDLQMDPTQFTPSSIQATTVNLGRKINVNYQVDSYYTVERRVFQLVGRRRITDYASLSLTASPDYYVDANTRGPLVLGGFSWIF